MADICSMDFRERFGDLPFEGRPTSPSFVFVDALHAEPTELPWLINGLLPAVGVGMLGGPSGAGKSFLAIDIVRCVATGSPILGRRTRLAPVVYVSAEAPNGVRKRFKGARSHYAPWVEMIALQEKAVALNDPEALTNLKNAIREHGPKNVGLIVIDTLSACMPGVDENSSAPMTEIMAGLQGMAIELQTCVLVVTHTGKDVSKKLRGHSSQFASADAVVILDPPVKGAPRTGVVEKVKEGEAGMTFAFDLRVITIGVDADGEPDTTCVVEGLRSSEKITSATPTKRKLNKDFVRQVFDRVPKEIVPTEVSGQRGVMGTSIVNLRMAVFAAGLLSEDRPDDGEGETAAARWKMNRKKAWQFGLQDNVGKYLAREGDWVWGKERDVSPYRPSGHRNEGDGTDHPL